MPRMNSEKDAMIILFVSGQKDNLLYFEIMDDSVLLSSSYFPFRNTELNFDDDGKEAKKRDTCRILLFTGEHNCFAVRPILHS